jgi:ATP-dependent Clp protease ATP-binding subunit ClpA
LEQALHHAIKLASDRHHEYATLEHLLLALMDDTDASQVMKACNVDMDALRKSVQKYVDEDLATLVMDVAERPSPPPVSSGWCSAPSCMCRIPAATR